MVGAQALQRRIDNVLNMIWPAIEADDLSLVINLEAEFRADENLFPHWLQGFTNQFFVGEGPITLCRIEQCHAPVCSSPDDANGLCAIGGRAEAETEAHAAETDGRDVEVAKFTCVHDGVFSDWLSGGYFGASSP